MNKQPICKIGCVTGNKYWYLNDLLHREDGPAYECTSGYKLWYLHDKHLDYLTFKLVMDLVNE